MVNSDRLISVEGDVMSVAQQGTKESEFSDIGVIGRETLTRVDEACPSLTVLQQMIDFRVLLRNALITR